MYPRVNYEMTEDDLKAILEASRSTPVMYGDNGVSLGGDQQANANAAWSRLAERMGFDYMTVQPIVGKGQRFFSAVPSENEVQRDERVKREAEQQRRERLVVINTQIALLQHERDMLDR